MRVCGLDLSLTGTGVATADTQVCLSPPGIRAGRTRTPDDDLARLLWFKSQLARLFNRDAPELVVIEDHSGGHTANAHTAFQLGELAGIVKVMLAVGTVPMVLVASSKRQKFATGKGNAPKEAVLKAAWERLHYDGHDHNIADACWLRAMGCAGVGQPIVDLPKTHLAALEGIEWPTYVSRAS